MLCSSFDCKKYAQCGRSVHNFKGSGYHTVENLASFGKGSFITDENGEQYSSISHECGELGNYQLFVPVERKFCGLGYKELRKVLEFMCDIEPRIDLNDEEIDKFDVAIQCVNTVLNCMVDDSSIDWEIEDEIKE